MISKRGSSHVCNERLVISNSIKQVDLELGTCPYKMRQTAIWYYTMKSKIP